MASRWFVDISNYTERFEAHRYAAGGSPLVAILATDGLDFTSDRHATDAAHAHEAGLIVWHYHFARPEADPAGAGEAAHFWQHARPHYQPGDRLVLDLERHHPSGRAGLISYTHQLAGRLHNISGVHAVGYTYDSLLRETGPGWQVASSDWWIASPSYRPRRLGAGRRMIARQTRLDGAGVGPERFPGVTGFDVDQLALWYSRRLARERRRRGKASP